MTMSSNLGTSDLKHREAVVMGYDTEARRNSPNETPCSAKEKVMFPRASRSQKLQDKPNALKPEKPIKQSAGDQYTSRVHTASGPQPFQLKTSGNFNHNQRRNREHMGVEELVKYMSNVPAYLQLLEKGDTNQEKALNVGVLDWGRLRKWTHSQRPVVNQKDMDSPSVSKISSSFSANLSPKESCKSSGSASSATQKNQSVSSEHPRSSCAEEGHTQPVRGKTSRQFVRFLSPEFDSGNISVGRHQVHRTDNCEVNSYSEHKLENNNGKVSDAGLSGNAGNPQQFNSSTTTSGYCEMKSPFNKEKYQGSKSRKDTVQVSDYEPQSCSSSLLLASDSPQDCSTGYNQHTDDLWDHLQDRSYGSQRFSFESTGSSYVPKELDRSRFSGMFLSEEDPFVVFPSDVPHSCPLPSSIEDGGWLDTSKDTLESGQGASPGANETPSHVDETEIIQSNGKLENSNSAIAKYPKLRRDKTPDRLGRHFLKSVTAEARETSPTCRFRASTNGMIRSSSLSDFSVIKQTRGATPENPIVDKATAASKSRRSPLRRMLDPLLKPKASNRCQESAADSPVNLVRRLSFSHKPSRQRETELRHPADQSPNAHLSSCPGNDGRKLTSPNWVSTNSHGALQGEKHGATKSQALLRFAWRNGQPLFTFSMNNTDMLAATRKKAVPGKEDFECTYTFYYFHEIKKKNSGWMNQGSKSKRQALVSNVAGKMNVSFFRCLKQAGNGAKAYHDVREFVLFGAEIKPTALQAPLSIPDSELAAIVLRSPEVMIENFGSDLLRSGNSTCSSNMKLSKDECSSCLAENNALNAESSNSGIVAIFPSGVHGLSDAGAPSPLIERWKSGGSCDCGGWDVGCSLTILTEKIQESSRSSLVQSCFTADGTHRAELFAQGGGAQESRPVFSLIEFKEGLYTVDFDSSIAKLQAFSVCVAILHSRKPQDLFEVHNSLQHASTEAFLIIQPANTQGGVPSSYVPHHPPLSPVGRA